MNETKKKNATLQNKAKHSIEKNEPNGRHSSVGGVSLLASRERGITLISLVITIIVLLILAGAAVSMALNEGNLFAKANEAKTGWNAKTEEEENVVNNALGYIEQYVEGEGGNADVTFSTEYGRIEVIWLSGTSNTVSNTPNVPKLGELIPISYNTSTSQWEEVATTSTSYYDYIAGNGNEINTASKWANAKNSDGNIFVWIPRFAYRITYYSNAESTEPTGFYDGLGQWRASDGRIRVSLDSGIETVDYNNKKYIVHPAFCGEDVGYDNGSWDVDITGFWVSKNRFDVNSKSVEYGYNTAKAYLSSMESHLEKNSEWGAVAYLNYSQYGLNGYNLTSDNTGNYGVNGITYDINFIAAFNCVNSTNYSISSTGSSDKYATKYYNNSTSNGGNNILFACGKVGDATKEVNKGGIYSLNDTYSYPNWFDTVCRICNNSSPFFKRGGVYNASSGGGLFCSNVFRWKSCFVCVFDACGTVSLNLRCA